ncbi:hypothetical protein JCM11251_007900 [Rhodosporidiobolus azoricus]
MTSFNPEELLRNSIFVTSTPSLLPLLPPTFHDELQDDLSSFPDPGRYVFSLEYQKLYVKTEKQMQQKKGEGKKIKAGKVRRKVEKEWEKATSCTSPAQLEDTAASNGHKSKTITVSGHGATQGKHQIPEQEGAEDSEEDPG